MTVAVPAATSVTMVVLPVPALTVATVGLLLCHVIARNGRRFPAASRGSALTSTKPPTTSFADPGATATEATGANATET